MGYLTRRRADLRKSFLLFLYGLFILATIVLAHEAEVEGESEFTYHLNTKTGPENWANLKPNWKACNGKLQSPIDLSDDRVIVLPELGNLERQYKQAPAVLKNRGHDIMLTWEGGDAGGVVMNGSEYKLLQCHWHTPSEHTINGERFKMEIHLVHQNSEGQISVIGILYELGRPDPLLAKLLRNIKTVGHEGTNVGVIDPWEIEFGGRKYLRYIGSLTVPPCTEGVVWTILKKVRTVSAEQIRELREAVHDGFERNSRPVQHQSDEVTVFMYRPETHP